MKKLCPKHTQFWRGKKFGKFLMKNVVKNGINFSVRKITIKFHGTLKVWEKIILDIKFLK